MVRHGQESIEAACAGAEKGYVTARVVQMPPNPVRDAALRYMHDHGERALNSAIEGLLKDLFAS